MRLNELAISFLFAVIVVAPQQGLAQPRNLLASIREGDPGTVETLLRSGADPNTRDESGATALMHAAPRP
jgi:ankyrin repeat protein